MTERVLVVKGSAVPEEQRRFSLIHHPEPTPQFVDQPSYRQNIDTFYYQRLRCGTVISPSLSNKLDTRVKKYVDELLPETNISAKELETLMLKINDGRADVPDELIGIITIAIRKKVKGRVV